MTANPAEPVRSRVQSWIGNLSPWRRRGVAVLAGAVATLGHAPFQLTALYVLALAVLVLLLDVSAGGPRKLRSAFAMGWLFALGHFSTGIYWISSAFDVESDTWGPLWGIPLTLALAGGLALFWGFGCALAVAFWTRDMRRIAAFAASLFVFEWLRGNILSGFPWLLPGYVWTPGEPISQLASVIGIYGLSLITLLVSGAVATIADGQSSQAQRFTPTIVAALILGMAWGWGAQRIAHAPVDPPGAHPLIRVADSGLTQAQKWAYDPQQEWRVLARYLQASGSPQDAREAVVIWPEGAIPTLNFFMLDNAQFMNAVGRGMGDRVLITGFSRCAPRASCDLLMSGRGRASNLRFYNSAAVIDGVSGVPRLSQIYDKHHLVPFGEYTPPLIGLLPIPQLQQMGQLFTPGPRPTRLVVPDAPPAVILICYESIFPGLTPRGDERPGWIINISNDAWFGDVSRPMSFGGLHFNAFSTGPWQAFEMARYRAIEEGLPLARSASGGVSAVIDAMGRVVRTPHIGAGGLTVELPPSLRETPYVTLGNWLLLALLVFIAALRFAPPPSASQGRKPS